MYEGELRSYLQANNGPSYDTLTQEVAEALGVDVVLEGPQATGGTHYQYSQRSGVEQINGKWYTKYILGPVFADGETTAAEQEAAYRATKDAEQAKSVRDQRKTKLAESDWTQIADSTADKAAWATYRQALRDVPSQSGFPWEVTWPTTP
jgi:hypothetical protein